MGELCHLRCSSKAAQDFSRWRCGNSLWMERTARADRAVEQLGVHIGTTDGIVSREHKAKEWTSLLTTVLYILPSLPFVWNLSMTFWHTMARVISLLPSLSSWSVLYSLYSSLTGIFSNSQFYPELFCTLEVLAFSLCSTRNYFHLSCPRQGSVQRSLFYPQS